MNRILLTFFEPFGGESINSSACAAALVRAPEHCELITQELPVEYERSVAILTKLMREYAPDALVMLGQAAGRSILCPERIGINRDEAGLADNSGEIRSGSTIRDDGSDGYFSTLPIEEMVRASREAGVPAGISNSAGTFVCNHVLYSMLYYQKQNGLPLYTGFIHVPATPQQAAAKSIPSMDSKTAAHGISAMLTVLNL